MGEDYSSCLVFILRLDTQDVGDCLIAPACAFMFARLFCFVVGRTQDTTHFNGEAADRGSGVLLRRMLFGGWWDPGNKMGSMSDTIVRRASVGLSLPVGSYPAVGLFRGRGSDPVYE